MITPKDYVGALIQLSENRRGEFVDMQFLTELRTTLVYYIPLAEASLPSAFCHRHAGMLPAAAAGQLWLRLHGAHGAASRGPQGPACPRAPTLHPLAHAHYARPAPRQGPLAELTCLCTGGDRLLRRAQVQDGRVRQHGLLHGRLPGKQPAGAGVR